MPQTSPSEDREISGIIELQALAARSMDRGRRTPVPGELGAARRTPAATAPREPAASATRLTQGGPRPSSLSVALRASDSMVGPRVVQPVLPAARSEQPAPSRRWRTVVTVAIIAGAGAFAVGLVLGDVIRLRVPAIERVRQLATPSPAAAPARAPAAVERAFAPKIVPLAAVAPAAAAPAAAAPAASVPPAAAAPAVAPAPLPASAAAPRPASASGAPRPAPARLALAAARPAHAEPAAQKAATGTREADPFDSDVVAPASRTAAAPRAEASKAAAADVDPFDEGGASAPRAAAAATPPATAAAPADGLDPLLVAATRSKARAKSVDGEIDEKLKGFGKDANADVTASHKATLTPLSRADVVAVMKRLQVRARDCRDRYGDEGVARLKITVAEDGHVSGVALAGVLDGTATGVCVQKAVSAAVFPPSTGLTFDYSLSVR